MATRKSVTEPIQDDVVVAKLAKDATTFRDPSAGEVSPREEPVTVNQEMRGTFTLDHSFKQVLLLLGLEAYQESKVRQANEKKEQISKELEEDLETISIIREHIKAGEF